MRSTARLLVKQPLAWYDEKVHRLNKPTPTDVCPDRYAKMKPDSDNIFLLCIFFIVLVLAELGVEPRAWSFYCF